MRDRTDRRRGIGRQRKGILVLALALALGLGLQTAHPQQEGTADLLIPTATISVSAPSTSGTPALPTAERGGEIRITAKVRNEGQAAAGPFDISFEIFRVSENLSPIGEPRELKSTEEVQELACRPAAPEQGARCRISGGLNPDGERSFQAVLFTENFTEGLYGVAIVVDQDGEVNESQSDRKNNRVSEIFLRILPVLPNLTVLADAEASPAKPRQGDLLTVEFTVINDRPASVDTPFQIDLAYRRQGDTQYQELTAPALHCPGCSIPGLGTRKDGNNRVRVQAQIITTLLEPGPYDLRITVDPERPGEANNIVGTVEEADERDNVLTTVFELLAPLKNLAVGLDRLSPQAPPQGELVSLFLTITNESVVAMRGIGLELALLKGSPQNGEASMAEFDMRDLPQFSCGRAGQDLSPGQDECANLAIESEGELDVRVQFRVLKPDGNDLPDGRYELRVVAIPPADVVETDPGDNTLIVPMVVVKRGEAPPDVGPELHPLEISFVPSSPVDQGQVVLIRSVIENSGNRNASSFQVQFSYRHENADLYTALGEATVDALKLGKRVEKSVLLETEQLEPGLYAIKVEVVATGQTELDVNNNALIAFLTLIAARE